MFCHCENGCLRRLRAGRHLRHGNAGDEIVSLALTIGASYIIMATHGHRGVRRLIVGSVAEDVIRRSTRPVLAIRSAFNGDVFAILGLRALFFLLAGVMDKFHRRKIGLPLVLVFVGTKMAIMDIYKIPIGVSLGAVAVLIGGLIITSLLRSKAKPPLFVAQPLSDGEAALIVAAQPTCSKDVL